MIEFRGIITKDKKFKFIKFGVGDNEIEIPIETPIADRITKYLNKLIMVKLENKEENEED